MAATYESALIRTVGHRSHAGPTGATCRVVALPESDALAAEWQRGPVAQLKVGGTRVAFDAAQLDALVAELQAARAALGDR